MRRAFALSAARQSLPPIACRPRPAVIEHGADTSGRWGVATLEGAAE